MNPFRKFAAALGLVVLVATLALAQQWAGIIATSRAINWSNAGLPALLPDGEIPPAPWTPPVRTTLCATIASGASSATIQTTLNGCAAKSYVQLPCDSSIGTSQFTSKITVPTEVELRGCHGQTKLKAGSGASLSYQLGSVSAPSCNWTAGYAQGATSITTSCNPGVGNIAVLFATTGIVDPGLGVQFACSGVNVCSTEGGNNEQEQNVVVTAVSGSGPYTVTISPGLYAANWATLTSPKIEYVSGFASGNGIVDVSIDCAVTSTNPCVDMGYCYGCYWKGGRILNGTSGGTQLGVGTAKNYLIENSYFDDTQNFTTVPENIGLNTTGDGLIVNNVTRDGPLVVIQAAAAGDVIIYNFARDGFSNSGNQGYIGTVIAFHETMDEFILVEANQFGQFLADSIHSSQCCGTIYRNIIWGGDPPYPKNSGVFAVGIEGYARFFNILANALGSPNISNYKTVPGAIVGNPIYIFGNNAGATSFPSDPLSFPSSFLYGNYDTIHGAVEWNSGEVPSTLTEQNSFTQTLSGSGTGPWTATLTNTPIACGNEIVLVGSGSSVFGGDLASNGTITGSGIAGSSTVNCSTGAVSINFTSTPASAPVVQYLQTTASASPFANPVPGSHAMPLSLYFTGLHTGSAGTGLFFAKVCTNYPTCTTFKVFPQPGIGPDVTGGQVLIGNYFSGYANDIPAATAWYYMPVDTSYSVGYQITSSSYNAGTSTETLTFGSGVLPTTLVGPFQFSTTSSLSGITQCPGTISVLSECFIDGSTATTLSYFASSNPGSLAGQYVFYSDVRQWDETVFLADVAGNVLPPLNLSLSAH